jgi:uncharacterized protein
MKCPNCNVNLLMTDRNGIEIDYCPECRGVWLDRGELDKSIERSSPSARDTQPAGYSEQRHFTPDRDYKYKKKKGLLGELFDF